MSDTVTPDVKQARLTEFLRLLPLTIELAGLPKAATSGLGGAATQFTVEQMETRVAALRTAYKYAQAIAREVRDTGV